MDTTKLAMLWGAAVVGLVALLVFLGSIWGEMHYRNCLQSVELRYPVAFQQPARKDAGQFGGSQLPHFAFYEQDARDDALSGCSRRP